MKNMSGWEEVVTLLDIREWAENKFIAAVNVFLPILAWPPFPNITFYELLLKAYTVLFGGRRRQSMATGGFFNTDRWQEVRLLSHSRLILETKNGWIRATAKTVWPLNSFRLY